MEVSRARSACSSVLFPLGGSPEPLALDTTYCNMLLVKNRSADILPLDHLHDTPRTLVRPLYYKHISFLATVLLLVRVQPLSEKLVDCRCAPQPIHQVLRVPPLHHAQDGGPVLGHGCLACCNIQCRNPVGCQAVNSFDFP